MNSFHFTARALADGRYSQYETSLDFTDPQHLHSTPSREDLSLFAAQPQLVCEHCGETYEDRMSAKDQSIFYIDPQSRVTSDSTLNSKQPIRMTVCHFCHTQRLASSTEHSSSSETFLTAYQPVDVVEFDELMDMSVICAEPQKESVANDSKVQLSLNLELASDGSIKQISPNRQTSGQCLNIKLSVIPPTVQPEPCIEKINPPKHKSTQTPTQNRIFQFTQENFVRQKLDPERPTASARVKFIWQNINRGQDHLMNSFKELGDALLELVELCAEDNEIIVVKPFWGHGTFGPTSCFHQFGDPESVNVLVSAVDRISGAIAEEFVAALSLVRCVLARRPDLLKMFRVEIVSDLLTDGDVDRVLREICEVFGQKALVGGAGIW